MFDENFFVYIDANDSDLNNFSKIIQEVVRSAEEFTRKYPRNSGAVIYASELRCIYRSAKQSGNLDELIAKVGPERLHKTLDCTAALTKYLMGLWLEFLCDIIFEIEDEFGIETSYIENGATVDRHEPTDNVH